MYNRVTFCWAGTWCSVHPVVCSARSVISQERFKPSVCWQAVALDVSDVPFPDGVCAVALLFQHLREQFEVYHSFTILGWVRV